MSQNRKKYKLITAVFAIIVGAYSFLSANDLKRDDPKLDGSTHKEKQESIRDKDGNPIFYKVEVHVFEFEPENTPLFDSISDKDIEEWKESAKDFIARPVVTVSAGVDATFTIAQEMVRPIFGSKKEQYDKNDIGISIDFIGMPMEQDDGIIEMNMKFEITEFLGFKPAARASYPLIFSRTLKFSAPIEEGKVIALPTEEHRGSVLVILLRVSKVSAL